MFRDLFRGGNIASRFIFIVRSVSIEVGTLYTNIRKVNQTQGLVKQPNNGNDQALGNSILSSVYPIQFQVHFHNPTPAKECHSDDNSYNGIILVD